MKDSIIRLRALEKQLYAYLYALTVIDFDAETIAPEGSADGRAEATEVLSRANFDLLVNEKTAALLKEAAADAETEQEKAEVRNLQRQYDEIAKIPADEYAAFTKLCSQSVPAWVKAKRTNDFSIFAPYLEKIVAARRAQAHYFAPDRDPYEVLLDRYEKGLTIAQCDEFFATLRETIVPLLADIQTRQPISVRNEPVGSTNTIITSMYQEHGVTPSPHMAGLMASAILSDTVMFKSPTCTKRDIAMAERLARIAKVSLKDLGRELFSGSNDSKSAEELLRSDFKEFHISEQVLGVGQITCIDSQKLMERKEELLDAMRKVCRTHSYDMVILMLTDVLQEGSQLLYIGSDDTIRNAFGVEPKDNTVFLPGVMSRKKQVIPMLTTLWG